MAKGQEDGRSSVRRIWFLTQFLRRSATYGVGIGAFGAGAGFALGNIGSGVFGAGVVGKLAGLDPVTVGVRVFLAVTVVLALFYAYGFVSSFGKSKRYIDGNASGLPEPVRFVVPRADADSDRDGGSEPGPQRPAAPRRGPRASGGGTPGLGSGSLLARRPHAVPDSAEGVTTDA